MVMTTAETRNINGYLKKEVVTREELAKLAHERGLKSDVLKGVCLSHPYVKQIAEVAKEMVAAGEVKKMKPPQKLRGLLAQTIRVLMVVIKEARDIHQLSAKAIYEFLKEALPKYAEKLTEEVRNWLYERFEKSKETILIYIRKFLKEYAEEESSPSREPSTQTKEPNIQEEEASHLSCVEASLSCVEASLSCVEASLSCVEAGRTLTPKEDLESQTTESEHLESWPPNASKETCLERQGETFLERQGESSLERSERPSRTSVREAIESDSLDDQRKRNLREAQERIKLMKRISSIAGYAEMEEQCPLLKEILLRNPHLIEPLERGEITVKGEVIQSYVSQLERLVCLGR